MATRAGIFIGVDRAGALPQLQDAAGAANRMATWARNAGTFDRVEVVTDENNAQVTAAGIFQKIDETTRNGIDQLVVYFAGHGIAKYQKEYWLLTGAPGNSNEAVNLDGTAYLARSGSVGHVIFISDACRTLPQDAQMDAIDGSEVFPNKPVPGDEKAVDQLFAARLGAPALELRDPLEAARRYRALYTEALIDALEGKAGIGTEEVEAGAVFRLIHTFELSTHLETELTRRLKLAGHALDLVQEPTGRIVAHKLATWIARVDDLGSAATHNGPFDAALARAPMAPQQLDPAGPADLASQLVAEAVAALPISVTSATAVRGPALAGISLLEATTREADQPPGRDHFESLCGLTVQGARIREVLVLPGTRPPDREPDGSVRFWNVRPNGQSTLVIFDDGSGALLPLLPEFVITAYVDNGGLVDVAYEPAFGTWRWNEYAQKAVELRRLRSVISFSTRNGLFRLGEDEAGSLAQRMQYSKGVDPSLAIYAAYAYDDLGRQDRIRDMAGYMRADIGTVLFDVACLAGGVDSASRDAVLSPFPLLQQGWPSLRARGVQLPDALDGVQGAIRPAVWTTLEPRGVEIVRRALLSGAFA